MNSADLNVSLESDAADRLPPLLPLLPTELAGQLVSYVGPRPASPSTASPAAPPIPYTLLFNISRWTRTPEGRTTLASANPPLPASDYEMIALLAGARTSPEKHFPMVPGGSWDERRREHKREKGDRRAVANIVNALVSIVGCAVAVWYAAGSVGWRDEWRVLLALLAAAVVGTAEAVLYIIWTSAPRTTPRKTTRKRDEDADQSPRADAPLLPPSKLGEEEGRDALRQRRALVVQDGR